MSDWTKDARECILGVYDPPKDYDVCAYGRIHDISDDEARLVLDRERIDRLVESVAALVAVQVGPWVEALRHLVLYGMDNRGTCVKCVDARALLAAHEKEGE